MSVWITGDIHGIPERLGVHSFYEQKEFSGDKDENVVIIAGDFGLVWQQEESAQESYWLKWLEEKPFTTVFVDGNHENHLRLATYPVTEWHGGKVHEIRPHVLHLMRGKVYNIEGKTYFTFGGASSHDISDGIIDSADPNWREQALALEKDGRYTYRIKGLTWWEEELPNEAEMQNGLRQLERVGYKVDYVVTHTPPASIIALLGHGAYKQDSLTKYLEDIRQKLSYKRWFMGHMHVNKAMNKKDILLYEQIIRIS